MWVFLLYSIDTVTLERRQVLAFPPFVATLNWLPLGYRDYLVFCPLFITVFFPLLCVGFWQIDISSFHVLELCTNLKGKRVILLFWIAFLLMLRKYEGKWFVFCHITRDFHELLWGTGKYEYKIPSNSGYSDFLLVILCVVCVNYMLRVLEWINFRMLRKCIIWKLHQLRTFVWKSKELNISFWIMKKWRFWKIKLVYFAPLPLNPSRLVVL